MHGKASVVRSGGVWPDGFNRLLRGNDYMVALADLLRALRDVVLPRGCAGCDMPDEVLCPQCRRLFCGAHDKPIGLNDEVACRCCAWYEGPARRAILAWKDHGDEECDAVFADALASLTFDLVGRVQPERYGGVEVSALQGGDGRYGGAEDGSMVIVPAPSSPKSMRHRGRNHLLPVARRMASDLRCMGVDATVSHDLRVRGVSGKSVQTGGAAQRSQRIEGHVFLSDQAKCRGRRVVVMDDIVTTGATMRQCVRVLQEGGAQVEACLALAVVRPRSDEL